MLCEQDKQLELQERSGIHACVLYRGQEQWLQQLLRFTEADKAYRERIAILVPEESLEATQSAIKRFIEPLAHVEFGVVEELFASWAELNIGLCESRLERAVQRCIAEGFEGLRIVVDMSWCADSNVSSKSVEKCIRVIDSLVGAHPLSVFAGFDRQKFSSRRLLHILPFYPSVWVNGVLSENIYHSKLPSVEGEQLQHEALLDYVLSQFDRDAGSLGRSELEGAIRLLKQIIDSMGDGVLVTDRSGALQLINRAAKDILGYDRGDLPFQERVRTIGNYRGDKQTPFPLEELPIARAMRGEEVDQVEIFIKNAQRPDGRWVSTTGRPLRGGQGEVRGGVVVFRDITQKKEGEEMRQRLEARMLQTQKLESLGLLAGGIAHDFNNLLMGIEGHASLAYEEATEANRERINTIRKTSTHLSELCNQLLDFAGRGSFANVPTDIEDLV